MQCRHAVWSDVLVSTISVQCGMPVGTMRSSSWDRSGVNVLLFSRAPFPTTTTGLVAIQNRDRDKIRCIGTKAVRCSVQSRWLKARWLKECVQDVAGDHGRPGKPVEHAELRTGYPKIFHEFGADCHSRYLGIDVLALARASLSSNDNHARGLQPSLMTSMPPVRRSIRLRRTRPTSRSGGSPNWRAYSRLNCDWLS
jgi:hypothetical protein